jgi:hypothetical protein
MKKQLRKPEHWQDFEGLCKKLWGEIWDVPHKIKKNGRLGQPQSGVDVYAIPKGEQHYWGIQCKGKDEYTDAKLTTAEIDSEIEKAKTFSPKLGVFIIATTAKKDVVTEEYVRNKDIESRESGNFEILLYCWEDIVDLIEENRETFNFYVNQQQYKDNYNFQVYFNNLKNEIIIEPVCLRTIKRYIVKSELAAFRSLAELKPLSAFSNLKKFHGLSILGGFNNVNYALCPFEIIMKNEGNKVIEDWRVKIEFEKDNFTYITDIIGSGSMGLLDISTLKNKRTYCEENEIRYRPLDNHPLVQNDNRSFKAWIEPLPREYDLQVFWTIIARDYNATGELKMIVKPKYEDEFIDIEVETEDELIENEIIEIKAKKNYPKEDDNEDNGAFKYRPKL